MRNIILGIDTSNYTTSLALVQEDGKLIANLKSPLPVKEGACGLRQSDAVFAHVKNIPSLMQEAEEYLMGERPCAVGVSFRPRNVEGSYMPCFLSGVAAAQSIASTNSVPIYRFSHQCGHIMAAIYSSANYKLLGEKFAALHVSGGTTEMLQVSYDGTAFSSRLVGATADLNAGQVIDRVGVMLGLPFPSGRHVEALALRNVKPLPKIRPSVKDFKINFSGVENLARKLYEKTGDACLVARYVLEYVESSIAALCSAYVEKNGNAEFLFAGGVMSNSIIRASLESKFNASFAAPEFSSDNAVGIAELARRVYISEKR